MSDLSITQSSNESESAFSGYPVAGGGFHCFAMTWQAFEMPRPGCVWTHSLIISDTDLAHIRSLSDIISLFRRPTLNTDYQIYSMPLEIRNNGKKQPPPPREIIDLLLSTYYGSNKKGIVQIDVSTKLAERSLLAFSSQQWPKLRRKFSFYLGYEGKKNSDFEIFIQLGRNMSQSILQSSTANTHFQGSTDWITLAAIDILEANPESSLRTFLRSFGSDFEDVRQAFIPLVRIFIVLFHESPSATVVLKEMAAHFANEADAKRLKSETFAKNGQFAIQIGGEPSILKSIVAMDEANCLPKDIANVETRSEDLAISHWNDALPLAIASTHLKSESAHAFLSGFAAALATVESRQNTAPVDLILELIEIRPSLLELNGIWNRPESEQMVLGQKLANMRISGESFANVVALLLKNRSWSVLVYLARQYRDAVLLGILVHLRASENDGIWLPSTIWDSLYSASELIIYLGKSGRLSPQGLLIASAILDPRSPDVLQLDSTIWLSAIQENHKFQDSQNETRSKVFLLSIALKKNDFASKYLISHTFGNVYESARLNILSDSIWVYLDPLLPWLFFSWDRCDKLIRGTTDLIVRQRWPLADFIATFQSPEQLQRALGALQNSRKGWKYAKYLCKSTGHEAIQMSPVQADMMKRFCSKIT